MSKPTPERIRDVLRYDPETGKFWWNRIEAKASRVRAGDLAGCVDNNGYLMIGIGGRQYGAHRLAWCHVFGVWPSLHVDHRDGDKSNNRIANLRLATRSQNRQNSIRPMANNLSGYLGVSKIHGCSPAAPRWKASIDLCGKSLNLGSYDSPVDAHLAYLKAKRVYHPFANCPTDADALEGIRRCHLPSLSGGTSAPRAGTQHRSSGAPSDE